MMTCFSHFSAGVMKCGVEGGGGARQEWEGIDPERQTKAGSEEFSEHLGFCLISGSCKAKNHHYYYLPDKTFAQNVCHKCGFLSRVVL